MDNSAWGGALSRFPDFDDDFAKGAAEFLKEPYEEWFSQKHPLSSPKTIGWINGHRPARCPHCGAASPVGFGLTSVGIRRYICRSCGRSFTPVTGTIFDSFKIPPTEWMEYLMHLFEFHSVATSARDNRNSSSTGRYWLFKVFAVLDGFQDSIVLGPHSAIDEMSVRARGTDAARDVGGQLPRGSSANRIVIAVGVSCWDMRCFAIEAGRGRIDSDGCGLIYGRHIEPGSFVTHDGDKSQGVALRGNGCYGDVITSGESKGLRDCENPLDPVNDVISSIRKFLSSHPGYSRARTQDWLNLFVFIWNAPFNRLEKIAVFMEMAIRKPILMRYRGTIAKK